MCGESKKLCSSRCDHLKSEPGHFRQGSRWSCEGVSMRTANSPTADSEPRPSVRSEEAPLAAHQEHLRLIMNLILKYVTLAKFSMTPTSSYMTPNEVLTCSLGSCVIGTLGMNDLILLPFCFYILVTRYL